MESHASIFIVGIKDVFNYINVYYQNRVLQKCQHVQKTTISSA